MERLSSFKIGRYYYGVIKLNENNYQVNLPTLGSSRSANHVSRMLFIKLDKSTISVSGDKVKNVDELQDIINNIKKLNNTN